MTITSVLTWFTPKSEREKGKFSIHLGKNTTAQEQGAIERETGKKKGKCILLSWLACEQLERDVTRAF